MDRGNVKHQVVREPSAEGLRRRPRTTRMCRIIRTTNNTTTRKGYIEAVQATSHQATRSLSWAQISRRQLGNWSKLFVVKYSPSHSLAILTIGPDRRKTYILKQHKMLKKLKEI